MLSGPIYNPFMTGLKIGMPGHEGPLTHMRRSTSVQVPMTQPDMTYPKSDVLNKNKTAPCVATTNINHHVARWWLIIIPVTPLYTTGTPNVAGYWHLRP